MDEAYSFMLDVTDCPLEDCGEKMVYLPEAFEAAGIEVMFSQTKVVEDLDRIFFLREGLIDNILAMSFDPP